MANDADNISIGANGKLLTAPVGTSFPTTIAGAWTSFTEVGYLSEDGVSISHDKTTSEVMAWQSLFPVRRHVTGMNLTITAALREFTGSNVELALDGVITSGGSPTMYTFTPNDPEDMASVALGVEWQDGAKTYRLRVPRVMVSEGVEFAVNRQGPSELPLTFSLMAETGVTPFTIISDDPAWAL